MAAPPMMMYGCGACKERFATREEMKAHFATDFHAYNAERKAKAFAPVDFPTYKALVVEEEEVPTDTPKFYCKICKKHYGSVQTLTAHLKSKQHLANKQKAIEDGASTVFSTASKFLLGSKYVSSKAQPKKAATTESLKAAIPSPVLHISRLPEDVTRDEIAAALAPFGTAEKIEISGKGKSKDGVKSRTASVQFDSLATSAAVLEACPNGKLKIVTANHATEVAMEYSKHQDLHQKLKKKDVHVCNICKVVGHLEKECPDRQCQFCKEMGHGKDRCPDRPCPACHETGHLLKSCEQKDHYDAVIAEIKQVTSELQERMALLDKKIEEAEAESGADGASSVEATSTKAQKNPAAAEGEAQEPTPAGSQDQEENEEENEEEEEAVSEEEQHRNWLQSCACLFCNHVALTPREAVGHMKQVHGFSIPVEDLVKDQNTLLAYLQRKVRAGLCLYCNERTRFFQDIYTLRKHMIDKSHCHINWVENVDEYAQFYNLPASTAWTPEQDEQGNCELPSGRVIVARGGHVHHEHRPGDYLMITGQETDLERRRLLLTHKAEQGAVVATGAKAVLSRRAYNQMVRQDIALHNRRQYMWTTLKTGNKTRPMFRGYMV